MEKAGPPANLSPTGERGVEERLQLESWDLFLEAHRSGQPHPPDCPWCRSGVETITDALVEEPPIQEVIHNLGRTGIRRRRKISPR